jgi:molybdopterin molybdotransferase
MITVDQALAQIDYLLPNPLEVESVALESSLHRVLRESITSPEDQPPFDRSSTDGYLVRADEPAKKVRLISTHSPGQSAPPLPPAGSAIRILTGSALPKHAGLIMQEDTRPAGADFIELLKKPDPTLIRLQGSHSRKGSILLPAPSLLQPGSITLLASLGITQPKVSRLPRVVHLVTGEELVDPNQNPAHGQIRDCNSILIRTLLTSFSATLVTQQRVGDDRKLFRQACRLSLATQPDILLLSGASSVGDHDHAGSVLEELGFTILLRQVSVRPGKPFILAQNNNTLAFGLPGNPLSHFVCFHLFVRRALLRLSGLPPPPFLSATLIPGVTITANPRETWWPCHLGSDEGSLTAQPLPWRDSSDLSSLAQTNGLLRVPAGQEARSPCEVLPTIPW